MKDGYNMSSSLEFESQEDLNVQIIKDLVIENLIEPPDRPKSNFIDLMNWIDRYFSSNLEDRVNLNKFVHNRIVIDGQFLQFCKEHKVSVKCLYKDSIISWKTDGNYEKFFVQGVFLIKSSKMEFIHSALFHKGNSHEDEVGFCVIVSEKNYIEYINFRNEFDNWISQRDRGNLNIRVFHGEDIPYTQDHSWEDLFLPVDIKSELQSLVENFLISKDFYLKNKIPWKRGILLYGEPGNGKTSIIRTIISSYNFKPVTIAPGAPSEAVREAFSYAEDQSPSLLYFEDLDSILDCSIDSSLFLNLMDGVSAHNGLLVLATANNISKLKSNITDRPSRFDRKFEIPLPDKNMAFNYIKFWFGKFISNSKCSELAKCVAKYNFSYAYIKELYISSMFESLSDNRQNLTMKDVDKALQRLIKDKNMLNNLRINTDKLFQ
jgi:hypothetical protein